MITVEKFVENFKKGFDKKTVEDIFLNGNCFHFALILKEMYDGEIVYDPHTQHFLTNVKGNYYDITGHVPEPMDEYLWDDMEDIDNNEYELVKETCIYKM